MKGSKKRLFKSMKGFTLMELLISVVIMVMMTGILLGKYPEATMKITLANANNALSLLIHEAQQRGSSVDSSNTTLGGYGVFLNRATGTEAVLFGDKVDSTIPVVQGLPIGNGIYDMTPIDERKSVKKVPPQYSYKKLCIASSTASLVLAPYGFLCNESHVPEITSLTVSFSRPNQTAHIYINSSTSTDYSSACIELYSPKTPQVGHIRSLKVYHSGMVTSARTPCN